MKTLLEFCEIPEHKIFKAVHDATLKDALRAFFRCDAGLVYNPLKFFKEHYGVNIRDKIHRLVYPDTKSNRVLFAVGINVEANTVAFLGVVLENIPLPFSNTKLLSHIAGRLNSRCDKALKSNFRVSLQYFGNDLLLDAIADHLAKGIPRTHVSFLCEGFLNLRNITFENNYFPTGLVVTRSDYAYEAGERGGLLLGFKEAVRVTPATLRDNRFWFLADGQSTFFLCNKNLQIFNMFLMKDSSDSSISSIRLSETLKGQDFALVTTPKELIITSSIGEEYTFANSTWRYRDFHVILAALNGVLPEFKAAAVSALLELLLDLLKTRSSSMIWIPDNTETIQKVTLTSTQLSKPLPLGEGISRGLLHRLARSDGSVIISNQGLILGYAAIANLSGVTIQQKGKRVGSGSTAAAFLSNYGLSVKVSQDGEASLFRGGKLLWKL